MAVVGAIEVALCRNGDRVFAVNNVCTHAFARLSDGFIEGTEVGLSHGHEQQIIRGDPATGTFSICYLKGGELQSVEAINNPRDFAAARKLIAERSKPDLEKLANPRTPLKELT
jgi:nitrite reductase/ring-hydroxylating ferredoxin subunit